MGHQRAYRKIGLYFSPLVREFRCAIWRYIRSAGLIPAFARRTRRVWLAANPPQEEAVCKCHRGRVIITGQHSTKQSIVPPCERTRDMIQKMAVTAEAWPIPH